MRISTLSILTAGLVSLALPALAQTNIDARAANQQNRIEQGEASGALNARESGRLENHQAKINGDVSAAESDGKVTKREHRKIRHEQNRQSKRIHHEKHDAQTAK